MQRRSVVEPIAAGVTDNRAALSDTVALIYESVVDPGRIPEAQEAIKRLLAADDILVIAATGVAETRADVLQDVPRGFVRSLGHALWLDIGESESGPVRIRIRRRPEAAPFSAEEIELLSLLRRHLQVAYCLKTLTHDDALGSLAGTHLVRSMRKGLVIVDGDCRILWRNPTAAEIFTSPDGPLAGDGRLQARRAFETARLELLVQEAADGKAGVMLVRPLADRHPCGLALAPLKSDYGMLRPETRGRALVLVTIKQMQRQIDRIAERLDELFGLTPAEQRLAALLLDGHSLQEASRLENKSLATVKTQLRSMLKKTGARSQAGLVNMFLSLPSIL